MTGLAAIVCVAWSLHMVHLYGNIFESRMTQIPCSMDPNAHRDLFNNVPVGQALLFQYRDANTVVWPAGTP